MNDLIQILKTKKEADRRDRQQVSSAVSTAHNLVETLFKYCQLSVDELRVLLFVADAYARGEIHSTNEIGERLGINPPKMTRVTQNLGPMLDLIHIEIDPADPYNDSYEKL